MLENNAPTVLVVDDAHAVRVLIVEALKRSPVPCTVLEAASLDEVGRRLAAWTTGTEAWPALILLDLHLPPGDSLELLETLRAETRDSLHVPVVMLSGSGSHEDALRAYRRGASGFAVKPIGFKRLQEVVDQILGYWLGAMSND